MYKIVEGECINILATCAYVNCLLYHALVDTRYATKFDPLMVIIIIIMLIADIVTYKILWTVITADDNQN